MKKLFFDDFQSQPNDSHQTMRHQEEENLSERQVEPDITQVRSVPERKIFTNNAREEALPSFTVSDFFDVDAEIYRGESEPRTEFDFLLTKILGVIKEVFFAHTVAFFWVNRDKQQMVLEAIATDSSGYNSTRRFPLGDDLVSKVALSGKPEFITEVNPKSEADLFRYYDSPASVKSFIGVPVFFTRGASDVAIDQPVAVVAVDSKASDEFGHETMVLLGKFTKLISAFIKSYNDKYELLLDAELLNSIRRLQERIRKNFSVTTIIQALAEESSKIISWDFLGIVLFEEAKHAWVVKKVTNRSHTKYITIDQPVDYPSSIVGHVIKQNTYALIHDLSKETTVRYNDHEEIEVAGSLISVPISSINKCYGALTIESTERYSFTC